MWRVVCQEHAYFTASVCNAGHGNSRLTYYVINKFRKISELTILLGLRSFMKSELCYHWY